MSQPLSDAPDVDTQPEPVRFVPLSMIVDAVAALLFVVIGRVSHGESLRIGGVLTTAWPFLVGAAVGWIVVFGWRRPIALLRTGIGVWVATVAIGMLLRWVSDQEHAQTKGIPVSFVVVAAVVLGLFLLGWRAIAIPFARRSARRAATAPRQG